MAAFDEPDSLLLYGKDELVRGVRLAWRALRARRPGACLRKLIARVGLRILAAERGEPCAEHCLGREPEGDARSLSALFSLIDQNRELLVLARRLGASARRGKAINPTHLAAFIEACERVSDSLEALSHNLHELPSVDPLTGVLSRASMQAHLQHELDRTQHTGSTGILCIVDLDHFKSVNDTFGHRVGDGVLKAVSQRLLHNLRPHDRIYRYGGEEFILLLPDTAPDHGIEVVERLRRVLADHPFEFENRLSIKVTASFGVARLTPGLSIDEIIDSADRALYAAKRDGRNQVRVCCDIGVSGRLRCPVCSPPEERLAVA